MASEILTEDVLIEILARLPVKSLIRFTCVCKYWLSLIKSHDFATKHYATRLGIQSHDHSEFDCFLTTFFPACSISTFRCENIYDMSFQSAFKIRPAVPCEPPRFGINHRDVIRQCAINGPCNGLFCLNLVKDNLPVLLLWNPATREVFKPPENSYQNGGAVVGLGYDPLNNDYKLLNFHGNGWGPSDPSIVSVYSLAANCWRPLDSGIHFQAPDIVVLSDHSSFNGGKLHFPLRFKSPYNKTISLLSFDIVDEVFVQTSMPDDVATGHARLGGFLFQGTKGHDPTIYSLDFKDGQDPVEIRIWVLNGYGPSGVWNEQRIALPSLIYATAERMLWKNMDIVIGYKMDGTITAYDFTTQQYHQMVSPPVPGNERIIGYTESLVSISTFIRQPPSAHHSAVEDHSSLVDIDPEGLMQDQSSVEMGLQGSVQDYLSLEFEQHGLHHHSSVQAQEQEQEDDDDGLSTDSAFLMPERQDFWESDMEFDDFEINDYLHPYRLKECERLSKLPYCLREVNQPMISNPCTF